MAEGLLRHALGTGSAFRVKSAGVAATSGAPASEETLRVLRESGIELNGHRSRPITSDLVREAMLILAMTPVHREIILELFPEAAERVFLVGEFSNDPSIKEIPDPIGGGRSAYIETRDAIVSAIPSLLDFLRQSGDIEEAEASGER
jgi:protein-tyrosine-phosphatase